MKPIPRWRIFLWRVYVRFILLARRFERLSRPLDRLRSQNVEARNIRNLVLQTALLGIVNGGVISFIPVYLARSGASSVEVGLITSLPAILTMFLAIPSGVYVQRHKSLVSLSSWSLLFSYLTYLILTLLPFLTAVVPSATRTIIWATVVIWGLSAIPGGLAINAWTSVLAQAIPPRRRPAINGLRLSILGLISAASVAAFGRVLDALPFPYNYQIVFASSFVAGLVSVYFFSRVRLPKSTGAVQAQLNGKPLLLRLKGFITTFTENKDFLRFSASALVYRWGLFTPIALYSIYWVNHLHATDTMIGLRSTIEQLTLAAAFYLWGRVATAKGFRLVLIISSGGYALYPIFTGVVPTMVWLLPVSIVAGLFAGGINISFFEAFLKACPEDQRPNFIAMNSLLSNLAAFLAPLTGAAISNAFGIQTAFFVGGGFLILGTILFYLLSSK